VFAFGTTYAFAQQSEADVFVGQAILAYDDRRYEEALGLLRKALKLDPANAEALYYTGLVYLALKNPTLAVQNFEKAREKNPTNLSILYQLGVAYFSLEQYEKASPLLEQVFREQPQLEALGYYVGVMRYRRNDYQGALNAFKTGTSADPAIQHLTRFYTGLSLGILGLPERAVAEVEEALKIQPGSPLTGPAERFRDTIVKARESEQRLRAEIRLGGLYDDNVSVNPQRSTDPTAESLRHQQGRSMGELASLRVDYSWLRRGPWEATASYSFFQTVYNNDGAAAFNVQDHLGVLGGFYRGTVAAMPYQLGLQYSYDWLTLGSNPFLERHTITPFVTLVENTGHLTTLISRLQFKNFLQDAATQPPQNRDARNWMVGPIHVFRFASDRHLIRIGYQFDYEDARGNDFSYVGHRILMGGQYTLPWRGTRLRYDYEIHFVDYPNTQAVFPVTAPGTMKRKDTEQLHYFRVEKPLPNNLTLSAEYLGTFSQSNLAVFDYHRNVFSLILTWTY
jgi:tetratricopeptide (TPR) repeat protein